MAYITQADMVAVVPADILTVAIDDENLGIESDGVWDIIEAAAARRVDGILAARYPVPFSSPYPDLVKDAAIVFAATMLYLRKGYAKDANPWTAEAEAMQQRLQKVADGDIDLIATGSDISADGGGSIISEPAKTYSHNEDLMV